ncbi:MAG: DUF1801 domain-containing protein [Marinosulfonomonas sp.]|nr:DUF1801 domain-containing protein [Marinosulfonomonas sp.]
MAPNIPTDVAGAIVGYPKPALDKFDQIRTMVFSVAASDPAVGPITETLKWGEPAYLTTASKSGSTIRLAWKAKNPDHVAIFLNCQTTMVETMRLNYPDAFMYQGNRALLAPLNEPLDDDALEFCVRLAQTYHVSKAR